MPDQPEAYEVRAEQYRVHREAVRRHFDAQEQSPDLGSYLWREGNLPTALLYAHLFLPPLVEIDGRVYTWLNNDDDDLAAKVTFIKTQEQLPPTEGAGRRVQVSQNHMHTMFLFDDLESADVGTDDELDPIYREVALLTELIAQSWKGWLAVNYPGRDFVVSTVNPMREWDDDDDWDIDVFEVTFYEDRE